MITIIFPRKTVAFGTITISAIFYIISLLFTVFRTLFWPSRGDGIFLFGWMPGNGIAWFGNIFLWIAWFGLARGRNILFVILSFVMSSIAGLLALSTSQHGDGLGFYFWLLSIGITMIGSIIVMILYLREPGSK